MGGEGLVGRGRADRAREGGRPLRLGEGGVDRAAGRVVDGARRAPAPSAARRSTGSGSGSASAPSSSSGSRTCAARSRSGTSTCSRCSRSRSRCGSSTRARSSGAPRSPIRRMLYLLGRCVWIARRNRPPRASKPVWPIWLLAGAAVFLGGLPGRPERRGAAQRDRRRLRRRGRRAPDRERRDALRAHAGPGETRRRVGRPMRKVRSASASRPTGAARLPTRGATPTGRSPTWPTCPGTRSSAGPGSGTSSGPRTRPRSSSTGSA